MVIQKAMLKLRICTKIVLLYRKYNSCLKEDRNSSAKKIKKGYAGIGGKGKLTDAMIDKL